MKPIRIAVRKERSPIGGVVYRASLKMERGFSASSIYDPMTAARKLAAKAFLGHLHKSVRGAHEAKIALADLTGQGTEFTAQLNR